MKPPAGVAVELVKSPEALARWQRWRLVMENVATREEAFSWSDATVAAANRVLDEARARYVPAIVRVSWWRFALELVQALARTARECFRRRRDIQGRRPL